MLEMQPRSRPGAIPNTERLGLSLWVPTKLIMVDEDPVAPSAESRDAPDSTKVALPQSLDELPPIERKYGMDARSQPTQEDIEHLCKVWAEIGRAILMRRRAAR